MYLPLNLASPMLSAAWPCYALLLILALTVFFYIIACAESSNGDENNADKKVAKKGATPTEPKIPTVATVAKFAGGGKTKKGNTVKPLGKLPLRLPKQLQTKKVIRLDPVVTTAASCSSSKGKASTKQSKLKMANSQASKAPQEKSEKVAPVKSSMSTNSMVKGHTDSVNSFARVEPRKTELLADSGSEENLPSVIPAPDEL